MALLRRELFIFGVLLLALAFLMHPDLLSAPRERFALMMEKGNFFHPFFYTILPYLFIALLRFFYRILKKFLSRKQP